VRHVPPEREPSGVSARSAAAPVKRGSASEARQRQNSASRRMIGSGMPSNHNSAPLPNPMTALLSMAECDDRPDNQTRA
jgi:hypothetical protein